VKKTRQNENVSFDLVIFDCDGVLVDSEVISCRAHAATLTHHGYAITADQVLDRFLGVSDREARLTIEAELGRSLPSDFEAQVKQATLQRYADDLQAVPYVAEAIAAIRLPKCVASSGTPEKIRHGLTCAGLYDILAPHIFSAGQVKRGKPAPRPVSVRRRTDAGIARPLRRDRGQHPRRHRRARRRDDRAGIPWRQPLPSRLCRYAACRRCGGDVRRYAGVAGDDR